MKSNNPIFNSSKLVQAKYNDRVMSINGTINKTIILLGCMLFSAGFSWFLYLAGYAGLFTSLMFLGLIGGLILSFMTIFNPKKASITAPLYAICQGFVVGSFSLMANNQHVGIISIAACLTVSIFSAMLLIYKTGLIKVTENFRIAMISALGGVFIFSLLKMLFSIFGVNMSFFHSGVVGLGISLIIVAVAAFNLMLDFDFIVQGEQNEYAEFMEWYFAFGLLASIIWLYVEVLRMLSRRR